MRRPLVALPLIAFLLASNCAVPRHRGRVFVFAKTKDALKLDPADAGEGESATVLGNIFDNLVQFAPDSADIVPALATRWTISPDGRTYTFTLRPKVKFHDGTPCDAAAVVFNIQRQMDPKSPYRYAAHFSYWNDFFKGVEAVTAIGNDQVRFHLKGPDGTFLANLALFTMGIVSPKAIRDYGADIGIHPVGTGPFVFATWLRGEKIVLKANPDYWGGKPHFDKLIFKPVPDNGARLLQLENGEVQGMDGVVPDDLPRIEGNPDLQLLRQPGMNVGYVALNNSRPPFNNLKVRKAMAYAINKQALVKAFFAGGKVGQAAINATPPTIWGYNDQVPDYPFDPAKARQLLAEAGYPNGMDLVLWTMPVSRPYMPVPQRIAEAIQGDLKAVGIRATLRTYDWAIYLQKLNKGEHEAALMGWLGDNGDPDNFLYTLLDKDNTHPPAAPNNCFYRGEAVHKLLVAARKATDRSERTRLYHQVQALAHEDVPMVPLFHSVQTIAFRKGYDGFKLNPTGIKRFLPVTLPQANSPRKP